MSQKTIGFNKTKTAGLFAGSIALVPVSIWVDGIIGVLGIFLGCFLSYLYGKRLFSKSPALVFTKEGISGFLMNVQGGFVPWSEVTKIGVVEKTIVLHVKKPEHFLNGRATRNCLKHYGTPVAFVPVGLEVDVNEVLETFSKYVDVSYIQSPNLASA